MMIKAEKRIDIQLNLDYDDKAIIGDEVNNLNDRDYILTMLAIIP